MKICIFGTQNSLYTKIVTKYFDKLNIEYDLILIKNNKNEKLSIFNKLFKSKRYIALSKFDLFVYKLIYKSIKYKKSKKYLNLVSDFSSYDSNYGKVFYTPNINHAKTLSFILNNNYDVGVFGGVGIVDDVIINSIKNGCLNAHPASLPECKGGGALENTLFKNLKPTVSVHYAIAEVDGGNVICKKEIELEKSDCFNHIHTKLLIKCGEVLSTVVRDIIDNRQIVSKKNEGKLNYWKNCTKKVRVVGLRNLEKMKAEL